MENKTERVMANVMAALNTFGVEYDTNTYGFGVQRNLSELVDREETVDYIGFDGGDNFKTKFAEFIEKPHYYKVSGAYWADDDKYVVIQFARLYEMTEEDWREYASLCGCEDPMEAQCNYGDPSPSYIRMNVRVSKGKMANLVRRYARYCWEW